MPDDEKKVAARPTLTAEEKRTRIAAAKQKALEAEDERKLDAQIERIELAEKFEPALAGKDIGTEHAIYDATARAEGFFVVKRREAILFRTFMDSKMGEVERCDFVSTCIVHPDKEAYLAARGRLPGIDIELSNRLAVLYGADLKGVEGK